MWPDTLTDQEFAALLGALNLAPIVQVVVEMQETQETNNHVGR